MAKTRKRPSKRPTRKPSRRSQFDKSLFLDCIFWGGVVFSFIRVEHLLNTKGWGMILSLGTLPVLDLVCIAIVVAVSIKVFQSYALPLFKKLKSL